MSGYAEQGLPIASIAMQNEPQTVPHDYPGMWMTPADQAALASQHLGPALAGTGTKILALDHNWALAHYASTCWTTRPRASTSPGPRSTATAGRPTSS